MTDVSDDDPTDQDPAGDDPADEDPDGDAVLGAGVEQFQKTAIDALRAARALLDAAEAIVSDPKTIDAVISTVSGVARDVAQNVAGFATRADRGQDDESSPDDDDGGFETIHVN